MEAAAAAGGIAMKASSPKSQRKLSRREALIKMGCAAAGVVAASCTRGTAMPSFLEPFIQRHFREMA
ncbi:MAG: hypothetical protein HYV36_02165, partial [Lentisphaerae bacterium]|nr:hypothetical protein [Lentisphaerota bacterium]